MAEREPFYTAALPPFPSVIVMWAVSLCAQEKLHKKHFGMELFHMQELWTDLENFVFVN